MPPSSVNAYGRQLTPEEIAAGAHREFVGGRWDEIGTLQFEFMKGRGLRPEHTLLDVGCGALRGGVHFIRYLAPGRYCGLDVNASLIEAGKREIGDAMLAQKRPRLAVSDSFGVSTFAATFDYAIAVSLFTHLPMNLVVTCLARVHDVLGPEAPFFASYWDAPASAHLEPIGRVEGFVTHYAADSYHYSLEEMRFMAGVAGMRVERVPEWRHPRGQEMLAFRRR